MRAVKRLLPLMLSLWMHGDVGLDINQTITYFRNSPYENGTYETWALQYQNSTNTTYLESVSPHYFHTACAVWIIPPLLWAMFNLWDRGFPFTATNLFLDNYFDYQIKFSYGSCCQIFIGILVLPLDAVASFLWIYIVIPFASFQSGIKCALQGEEFDETDILFLNINTCDLPVLKTFEYLGEALPQLILAVLFTANNYAYLLENDVYLGIPVPVSLISIIFSVGTLTNGLFTGLTTFYAETDILRQI